MPGVLVVENDNLERKFIVEIIRRKAQKDLDVNDVFSGRDAIRFAEMYHPEIIIMEILLPDMDGMAVIRKIKEVSQNSRICIVTASTEFRCAREAIRLRVFDYLVKPVKPAAILQSIDEMLREYEDRREHASRQEEVQKENPNGNSKIVEQAKEYINQNFREKITLPEVAAKVYSNPQYFSRLFRKTTGQTFTDYMNDLRVKAACNLLISTNYPAFRIASECGFANASYFNKVFTDMVGVSPQKYRKNYRK